MHKKQRAQPVEPQLSLAAQAQLLGSSDVVWSQLFQAPAKATLEKLGVTDVIPPSSQVVTNPENLADPKSVGKS